MKRAWPHIINYCREDWHRRVPLADVWWAISRIKTNDRWTMKWGDRGLRVYLAGRAGARS